MKRTQPLGLLLLLVFATSLFAGLDTPATYDNEVRPARNVQQLSYDTDSRETAAVLTWLADQNPNTNFGGWTNDYFFEYYVPAADGYISSIDFNFSDLPQVTGGGMSIWIFNIAYDWEEIATDEIADGCGNSHLGYYDEATGFEVVGTNWVLGGINAVEGADPEFAYDPLDGQAWPAFGAASISIEPNAHDTEVINVDPVELMGSTYEFLRGEPFGIVIRFNGFPDEGDADDTRMGFLSGQMGYDPQPSMKFYSDISSPDGRCGTNDWGWYIRSYVWDWAVNVFYTGDRGPVVADVTVLGTTTSTADRSVSATITDDNPGGGDAGVASAMLYYAVDGGDYMAVDLVADGDTYSADIPGQSPGSHVDYYISATDVGDLVTETIPLPYDIFQATSPYLFLYDASAHPYATVYMYPYFYGYNASPDDTMMHWDVWDGLAFGAYSSELLDLYNHVYYVGGFYPANVPDGPTFFDWMGDATADMPRTVFATGQDYGVVSGFADTTFPAGTFEHDYLGVGTLGPQDIVGGTTDLYAIDGVADDAASGYFADMTTYYDATQLSGTNWVDNMEAADHATAFITDPNNGDGPLAVYASGENWAAAYSQIDPYCIVFEDDTAALWNLTDYEYNIWGALQDMWWPELLNVDEETITPSTFALGNAYPNPFNPSTSFEFTVAQAGNVNITVYNALGQEIATLVDGNKGVGTYLVNWDAANMASGVYFYTLNAPGFTATQKMLLLK